MNSAEEALSDLRRAVADLALLGRGAEACDRLEEYEKIRVAFNRIDAHLSSGGRPPEEWLAAFEAAARGTEQPYRMPVDEGVARARDAMVQVLMRPKPGELEAVHIFGAGKLHAERQVDELIALVNAVFTARRRAELEP